MKRLCTLVALLFNGSIAYAERFPQCKLASSEAIINDRCAHGDVLQLNSDARQRLEWAIACNVLPEDEPANMASMIHHDRIVARQYLKYPVFGFDAPGFPVWKPNVIKNGDAFDCDIPPNVIWLGVCQAGCYAPGEQVLFSTGYLPIDKALGEGRTDLVTLHHDSTLDGLKFSVSSNVEYTRDAEAYEQDLLSIHTEAGASLTVTANHPLLRSDGMMQEASEFKIGDNLLNRNGVPDRIVHIDSESRMTKVYNIQPDSADPVVNIVVAQGVLSGSVRYQNEDSHYLNRLALRHAIARSKTRN